MGDRINIYKQREKSSESNTNRVNYMRDMALMDNEIECMECPNEAHIHALNVLLSCT